MRTKHTRGRWHAYPSGVDGRYDVFTDESEGMICQNAREEDACFIAAAPDLLEALRALIANTGRDKYSGLMDLLVTGEEVNAAHAAIAKATRIPQ